MYFAKFQGEKYIFVVFYFDRWAFNVFFAAFYFLVLAEKLCFAAFWFPGWAKVFLAAFSFWGFQIYPTKLWKFHGGKIYYLKVIHCYYYLGEIVLTIPWFIMNIWKKIILKFNCFLLSIYFIYLGCKGSP